MAAQDVAQGKIPSTRLFQRYDVPNTGLTCSGAPDTLHHAPEPRTPTPSSPTRIKPSPQPNTQPIKPNALNPQPHTGLSCSRNPDPYQPTNPERQTAKQGRRASPRSIRTRRCTRPSRSCRASRASPHPNPNDETRNPIPENLDPKHQTLNRHVAHHLPDHAGPPLTPNPKTLTLNPKPRTLTHQY